MDKATLRRTLRLIGAVCATILAVIGALGIDVPSIQDSEIISAIAALIAAIAPLLNHWFNNNYTAGAKMAQPSIKEYNDAIRNEVDSMGRGDDNGQ